MRLKKRHYIGLTALLILAALLFYKYYYVNPNADHNVVQKDLLNSFYSAFRTEDYGAIAELMSDHNPQMVINVRRWYGEVTGFQYQRNSENFCCGEKSSGICNKPSE